MNIVTMCRGGSVASVAAKMILQRYCGHEVIAIGLDNTSAATKKLVFDWADQIIMMSDEIWDEFVVYNDENHEIRDRYSHKLNVLNVGKDVWGDPFHEDLAIKIVTAIQGMHPPLMKKGEWLYTNRVLERIRDYKRKIAMRNAGDLSI